MPSILTQRNNKCWHCHGQGAWRRLSASLDKSTGHSWPRGPGGPCPESSRARGMPKHVHRCCRGIAKRYSWCLGIFRGRRAWLSIDRTASRGS
eukprot:scaffold74186_cov71-Phaeocystis_antarctica.AAC.1